MFEHSFFKKSSDIVNESVEKVFGKLEPVSKMTPNRFELPITSIRRILGDRFYDLRNSDTDVVRVIISDNGGFNIKDLKMNYEKGNELLQFISMCYQGFIELNGNNVNFSKDFMEKPVAKLCVTSLAGLANYDVSIEDFLSAVSTYDDNHIITGMKNMIEIGQVSEEIRKTDEAIHQMQNVGNDRAIQTLQQNRNDFTEKLVKLQGEIIDSFFEILKKFNNTDNVQDIYDITVIFANKYEDPEGKEPPIVGNTVLCYHDVASRNVTTLKRKFSL